MNEVGTHKVLVRLSRPPEDIEQKSSRSLCEVGTREVLVHLGRPPEDMEQESARSSCHSMPLGSPTTGQVP